MCKSSGRVPRIPRKWTPGVVTFGDALKISIQFEIKITVS